MTDDERNEFEKSIGTARRVYREHQHGDPTPLGIVVGALIRAVELLAGHGQFPGAAKSETTMPTTKAEAVATTSGLHELARVINERVSALRVHVPTSPQERPATFPDELVERVKGIIVRVYSTPPGVRGTTWMSQAARDILSELASMPCELPTSEPIAHTLDSCDGAGQSTNFAKSMWLAQWLRDTLSPILAAKDAEFARLKYEAADMERLANARLTDVDMVEDKLRHEMECAAKRIAELESRTPAIDDAHTRIVELEKCIVGLTVPVDADGKTPGQVGHAAWQKKFHEINGGNETEWQEETVRVRECEEASASAVLRTFGNGAEVLKMVRDRIEKSRIDSFAARQETPVQYAANAAYRCSMEFIDAEIANIEGVKP